MEHFVDDSNDIQTASFLLEILPVQRTIVYSITHLQPAVGGGEGKSIRLAALWLWQYDALYVMMWCGENGCTYLFDSQNVACVIFYDESFNRIV